MDQRVERERKTKKYIFNSKNDFLKGSFNCNAHKKSANFWKPNPSSLLSTNIQFWSKQTPLLDTVIGILYSSLGNFGISSKTLTMKST